MEKKPIHIRQFTFSSMQPWAIEHILLAPAWQKFWRSITNATRLIKGRVIWHLNSTAAGGGVAEMLRSLLPYLRGIGMDARWMVILADTPFFQITKRLHNCLHGFPGDGKELGYVEKETYEKALAQCAKEFGVLIQPKDLVVLHDPQTAGMIPHLKKKGLKVIWRCHIGTEIPNEYVKNAWDFLKDYLDQADAYVFTRKSFVPDFLDAQKVEIIPPSIDPFSPKNQDMDLPTARSILNQVGLLELAHNNRKKEPCFYRYDGSLTRVDCPCEVINSNGPPLSSDPLVLQVSRWDRLKDPLGVMQGFAHTFEKMTDTHLILAGPEVMQVSDDPEGLEVFEESKRFWQNLPKPIQSKIHLACLPMRDLEENAAIVNALQRQATVIVQKSLQEGFGLTVTEAMWKGRPVLASKIGGIQDQIIHEETGFFLEDPKDSIQFGDMLYQILEDRSHAEFVGQSGKKFIRDRFLFNRQLEQFFELFAKLLS